MNPRSSHTHCQIAQAVTQAKTWQRVYLPHPAKIELKNFPSRLKIQNTQSKKPSRQS